MERFEGTFGLRRFVRELARNADLEAFGAEAFLIHNHQGCLADAFRRGIEQQCLGVHLLAAGPAFGREVRIPGELQRYFFDHKSQNLC